MSRGNKNGPSIKDIALLVMAGIDPKTGLPTRAVDGTVSPQSIDKMLTVMDEQDAVNRYQWYNLPCNITSQELERMIYYKFQLIFFKLADSFYFMPFALSGGLDLYGRYNTVKAVPYSGGEDESVKKSKKVKEIRETQMNMLSKLSIKVIYGIVDPSELEDVDNINDGYGVIVHDFTKPIGQDSIPRCQIQRPILEAEAEIIPYLRTSMMAGTGVKGMRVNSAEESVSVTAAAKSVKGAALSGNMFIPIIGKIDFQDLGSKSITTMSEYLLTLQSLDNFRLSAYGISNGGIHQKQAHMLNREQSLNEGPVGYIMNDGLKIRQNFCNIVNSIWNLGIWCEVADNSTGDLIGFGIDAQDKPQGQQDGQPEQGGDYGA